MAPLAVHDDEDPPGTRITHHLARNLGLLESTVKAHLKTIFGRLKAANRTQAAITARELGWKPSLLHAG